jgi:hypothetical protein
MMDQEQIAKAVNDAVAQALGQAQIEVIALRVQVAALQEALKRAEAKP